MAQSSVVISGEVGDPLVDLCAPRMSSVPLLQRLLKDSGAAQEVIFGPVVSKGQQAGSPRAPAEAPQDSSRQAQASPQPGTEQASPPPSLPSPLPLRSPGSTSPSNMPLDHLLMLANMTNNQPEEWNASPRMPNQSPSMQGPSFNHFPPYRTAPPPMLHSTLSAAVISDYRLTCLIRLCMNLFCVSRLQPSGIDCSGGRASLSVLHAQQNVLRPETCSLTCDTGRRQQNEADLCNADDGQQLPDIPERELSLDVLSMDQLGAQRLESLGALGSFGQQNLGSLGKLGGPHPTSSYTALSQ